MLFLKMIVITYNLVIQKNINELKKGMNLKEAKLSINDKILKNGLMMKFN